jgi:hypothetical protein
MGIRTGMGKGRPAQLERVSATNPLKNNIDTSKSLKQSIIDAVSQAEWIPATNQPYFITALGLAEQWDSQIDRRDRIAEKLIAVLRALFTPETIANEADGLDALIQELRINETKMVAN